MIQFRKILLILISTAFLAVLAQAEMVEKKGVLVTKECVMEGRFIECPLWTYHDEARLVLFVHDDLRFYDLDMGDILKREIDEGFARNGVEVTGKLDISKNLIVATGYKAPPPPAKSDFKG